MIDVTATPPSLGERINHSAESPCFPAFPMPSPQILWVSDDRRDAGCNTTKNRASIWKRGF
jgi:hypothetical protein